MTLFGALSSGVSGPTAQSSAIGAISDNITNVSTVGYKNTLVDFQPLVLMGTKTARQPPFWTRLLRRPRTLRIGPATSQKTTGMRPIDAPVNANGKSAQNGIKKT